MCVCVCVCVCVCISQYYQYIAQKARGWEGEGGTQNMPKCVRIDNPNNDRFRTGKAQVVLRNCLHKRPRVYSDIGTFGRQSEQSSQFKQTPGHSGQLHSAGSHRYESCVHYPVFVLCV